MDRKASAKQLFFFSVINYIGTAIGILSVMFIYPKDLAFIGTIRYIDSIAQTIFPVMVLGASHALIKFYPALDEKHRRQLFNYSIASVSAISLGVLLLVITVGHFTEYENSGLLYYAFPIAVSLAFIELFKKQAQDLQRIAVPTLYERIIPKIVLPLAFLLLLGHIFSVQESILVYVGGYGAVFLLTAIYLFKRFRPGFNYRFKTLFGTISRKDYFRYSLYSFAGSLGSLLAFRIDGIIIPEFISVEANGIFSNGVTLASTLQIPAVGMFALYAPIISSYLQNHNMKELDMKYKEVARLLFFIGAVLYSCIFFGINDLFSLLPDSDKLQGSVPVIQILGFSVLINMATGFNGEIITYSRYYRFNLIAVLLLIVLNVGLNIYFLSYTGLGIIGVAYASFLSMTLFNMAKLAFIYKKFGLLPFDAKFLQLGIIFLLCGLGVYYLPDTRSHLFNLVYKTGLSLAINVIVAYRMKLVWQLNRWVDKILPL
ncbi:hypothetical protein CHU92_15365 [Flavobacterium cyanobacteriorum]|uniref:Uncharacterized protein n=1 Tax=Flavobacterium cyanobacteriorum TaxID=2022802 RepID=A0A255YRQ3_9FLAO|nr:oligosaccharide flippase family protein [Flavobacterium cyanobacteriorum]OYQ31872.1 hypothetical protein CHU92_15365 [Flavobacterium cyanobacteriorum]